MAQTNPQSLSAPQGRQGSLIGDPRIRAIGAQVIVGGAIVLIGWYLVSNTLNNLARQSIATGFAFMAREAGFNIGETLIDYSAASTYGRAFLVGIFNTLIVALVGIVLATVIGTLIGVARLSSNWLLSRLARVYVEILRNIPPLLLLVFCYALITESLPLPRQALNPLPGIFLSNRGFRIPTPVDDPVWGPMAIAFAVAVIAVWFLHRWAARRRAETGRPFPVIRVGAALIIGVPVVVWLAGGAPTAIQMPKLTGFNFTGGIAISPEFGALLFGLTIYTAAFIAEIVRSGILAVNYGQSEAALALGLSKGQVLRMVVLPQAMRIIIPPITSEYLNLTKNSSLAIVIGYPDLVAVANTAINQTGQAIEGVSLEMSFYLVVSLSISLFMNWYNKRIALKGR